MSPQSSKKYFARSEGMALLLVLGMVVLVSLIVVAFLTKSNLDSQANASFAAGASAELLATDAANTVIGGLQSEIHSSTNSTLIAASGTVASFLPLSGTNALPQMDKDAANFYTTVYTTTGNNSTLLRSSAYTTGAAAFPGDLQGLVSSASTSVPSLNGRVLSLSRWNSPYLLSSTANAQSSCPSWVYVNQSGPVKLDSWSSQLADSTNSQYIVGRFAYRVYDLSGLLDMNAAGFPTSEKGGVRIGRKGTLATADLYPSDGATIPGFNPGGSSFLLDWRGPATAALSGASPFPYISGTTPYDLYVNQFGQKYGFMVAPPSTYVDTSTGTNITISFGSANRFLDRSDLMSMVSTDTTEFSGTNEQQAFLSGVTSFTREMNAPTWSGTNAWTVAGFTSGASTGTPVASGTSEINPNFAKVLVTGTFLRNDGTIAQIGEPLIKTRFPLSKIALLSNPTANAAEIAKYFGLVFVPANTPSPNSTAIGSRTFDHWEYGTIVNGVNYGGTGTNVNFPDGSKRECLFTLAQIASAAHREPNFFELLQAGISSDSLGQATVSLSTNFTFNQARDQNIARHILQIGANVIDQYDADSIPTVIARVPMELLYKNNNVATTSNVDPDISGVENVPYIQLIGGSIFRRMDPNRLGVLYPTGSTAPSVVSSINYTMANGKTITTFPLIAHYFQFQLWNPHQNAANQATNTFRIVAVYGNDANPATIPTSMDVISPAYTTTITATTWTPNSTFTSTSVTTGSCDITCTPVSDMVPVLFAGKPENGSANVVSDDTTAITKLTGGYQSFTGETGTSFHSITFTASGTQFSNPHLLQNDDTNIIAYTPSGSGNWAGCSFSGSGSKLLGFWAGDIYSPYNSFTSGTAKPPAWAPTRQNSAYLDLGSYTQVNQGSDTTAVSGSAAGVPPGVTTGTTVSTALTGAGAIGLSAGLVIQLQVSNTSTNPPQWVPVQTIGPIFRFQGINTNQPSLFLDNQDGRGATQAFYANPPDVGQFYAHPDPRTERFGWGSEGTTQTTDPIRFVSNGPPYTVDAGPSAGAGTDRYLRVVDPNKPSDPTDLGFPNDLAFPDKVQLTTGLGPGANFVLSDTGSPTVAKVDAANQGIHRSLRLGQLWKNTTDGCWYTDRGAITNRVGDSQPQSVNPYNCQDVSGRPIMLNRPFRSVAELGYVFRDLPWRSLNFSRDLPSSVSSPTADAALLDLFSVSETPVRAGVINLNSASAPALTSLLLGTNLNPSISANVSSGTDGLASILQSQAKSLATQIQQYLGPRSAPSHVLQTAGDISTMIQNGSLAALAGVSKPQREALIAALADVHNARTWNVLIDVYAQSGRFPPVASGALNNFQVTGQKHLWVHVAIDRFTGKIVDRIVEQPEDEEFPH